MTIKAAAGTFVKFHELSKIEEKEDGTHLVWGIATLQEPDSDNEVCDYETAVPVYQSWSSKALKRTSGNGQEASMGNIRVQHGAEVGGKVVKLEFKDGQKEIWLGSEPINEGMVAALKGGFYTGYSQGGSYAWRACDVCENPMPMEQGANWCNKCKKMVPVLYGLRRLSEVSYVDSPAIGIGFQSVKANGSMEMVKFKKHQTTEDAMKVTKKVAREELEAGAFAYVGDATKPETWELALKFSTPEKSKRHIYSALARLPIVKSVPDDKREAVKAIIEAAAKELGIDLAEYSATAAKCRKAVQALLDERCEKAGLAKGLYAVSRYADIMQGMASLWEQCVYEREIEGDDSDVPEEVRAILDSMIESFITMATEEARELAARNNKSITGVTTMTPEELQKQEAAEKAAKKSLAGHFAKASSHHEGMAAHHEALADHHEALETMHDTAAKAMKADANEGAEGEAKGSTAMMEAGAQFHKSAAAENGKMAKRHDKIAKAHAAMCEHCDKMAESTDAESAKTFKAEFKAEADKLAKADADAIAPTVIKTTTEEDDLLARMNKAAQEKLMKDPEFIKEVEDRQRAKLLEKLGEAGAEALKGERIIPTDVSGAPGTKLIKRDEGKVDDKAPTFAKESTASSSPSLGF